MGFRVFSVTKMPFHNLWSIRLGGDLTAQLCLLNRQTHGRVAWSKDPLPRLLEREMLRIARDLKAPIEKDCVHVIRSGANFRVVFLWSAGRPGSYQHLVKPKAAEGREIKLWLRQNRN